ncbi:hypothetical protein [Moorena sp. SIO2C4]|uniref:hypothetical protein n=1 Tax=Moorena sp. SIO2C4 TaxID=2607824 RepID=UPI00257CF638|nr:hypothetical protein [Moorena sp. SIO2C4]
MTEKPNDIDNLQIIFMVHAVLLIGSERARVRKKIDERGPGGEESVEEPNIKNPPFPIEHGRII